MDISKLIKFSHNESIGKYLFSKAVNFSLKHEFGKSYEFFKLGLDILTCDCSMGDWLKPYTNSNKKLFEELDTLYNGECEYYFVRSYMMSFENNEANLKSALISINKYLNIVRDEYGYYIQGKILLGLNEYEEALTSFEKSSAFSESSRILYRIGRIKEEHLIGGGLQKLYYAFLKNPSSSCCARILNEYQNELELDENEKNPLLLKYIEGNDLEFHFLYEKTLRNQITFSRNNIYLSKESTKILESFIEGICANRRLFFGQNRDNYAYQEMQREKERLTFDALTDGQYGDYDDWLNSGGDIENLKDGLGY